MVKAKKKEGTQTRALVSQRMHWMVWGVLAALAILMVSAFTNAWETNQALRAEVDALEPMVAAAERQKVALEAQLVYVKSDEYVAAWSQTQAGMTRPGETLVRPIEAKHALAPTPHVIEVPVPAATPESFWSTLWRSLTGD
jgi:cell division protein FtsB